MIDDLDPVVLSALETLADALGEVPPPCWSDPDAWFEDPTTAARLCLGGCHALPECDAYAAVVRPQWGVWAGVNRVRRRAAA